MLHSNLRATVLAFCLVFSVTVAGCDDSTTQAHAPAAPAQNASSAATADSTDLPFGASSTEATGNIKTLADAIASNRGSMGDTVNTFSDGAQGLVYWGSERIEWKDLVAVQKTKPGRVFKDSDEELGKLICTSGMIIEIAAAEMSDQVYVGELVNDSGDIFRFIALRSTGDLVQQSNARFCGIVTGKVDYANSMGGETHAIQLVGMFDLPENHKPVADE